MGHLNSLIVGLPTPVEHLPNYFLVKCRYPGLRLARVNLALAMERQGGGGGGWMLEFTKGHVTPAFFSCNLQCNDDN